MTSIAASMGLLANGVAGPTGLGREAAELENAVSARLDGGDPCGRC